MTVSVKVFNNFLIFFVSLNFFLIGNLTRSYADPLGPPAERPRTGQVQRSLSKDSDDDINAEDLLPM